MEVFVDLLNSTYLSKIYINTEQNVAIINGVKKNINILDLEEKILDIIMFWPEKINYNNVSSLKIDCKVKVVKNNITDEFEFKGKLPNNFYEFTDILKEM